MEKMVYKAIIRYLKKHYPSEMGTIIKRAKEILPELKAKAPDLGGRENSLANNLDMFLLFLSFYEASDHRMSGEAIDEIIASLYDRLKHLILSLDSSLEETPRQNYVAFKKGKSNTVCLWPKDGWIEVVLNAKLGQISDDAELIYDISNRKWTAAQYAFKYFDTTDSEQAKSIICQTLALKK